MSFEATPILVDTIYEALISADDITIPMMHEDLEGIADWNAKARELALSEAFHVVEAIGGKLDGQFSLWSDRLLGKWIKEEPFPGDAFFDEYTFHAKDGFYYAVHSSMDGIA